ncbi:MAG: 50S ribosomal protein L31e [Candidatus Bathyarchaeia archaeon]
MSEDKKEEIEEAVETTDTETEAAPEPEHADTIEAPKEKEEKVEGEAEEEIEVVEERTYTIPLHHVHVVTPRIRRAPRSVRDVRAFIARHMSAEEVSISNEVNELLWARSINKPPRRIKVRAVKDKEGKVIVYPAKAA